MLAKEVAGRFEKKWGKYSYYWDTYEDISHSMKMYCKIHGDFELTPIEHYRRNPCPECQTVLWAKEALGKDWITLEQLALKFDTTKEDIIDTIAQY